MQLLFSLCNNFDRLTRLVHSFTDKGMGISCSAQIDALLNEGKGIVNIDFGKAFTAPTKDEPSCRSMQIYLTSEQPDLIMIEQILGQEGLICEQPEEADLIVCDAKEVDDLCLRYPRRMVIEESELLSLVNKFSGINLLRAIVASHITPVPQLPEHLSPCWAKLRKRCVASIDAGLTLFSEVVSSDPLAGDALLDQVAVEDGCLIRGKRFELVDRRTHPYSYYALLGLLSRSPAGSRGEALRMGIEALIDENPYAYDNALGIIAVPELKNFAGLRQADLRILEPATSGNAYKLSERWQSLNLLRQLTLRSDEQIDIDHLDAPHLEQLTLDGAGFAHILGIQECTHLKALDVASTDIADLGPVSNLHKTLNKLNISQTKINSFLPLGKYDFLEQLEISGCPNLNSLEGMPILNCESADFSFLCIGSLTGLGRSSSLNYLKVASCQSLIDIEELEELKSLERLEIKDCPQILDYSVLGRLPALKYVEITSGSSENVVLPSCWPGSLTELWINGNTSQIGDLPSQFAGTLDLTSVTGLTRLDNLRACSKIEEIKIRLSAINKINDFTPLSNCENLWINIDMEGDNCICDPTIESLSRLPSLRLRLDGYVNINLGPLVNLANLVGLDLDSWSHVTKAELLPVLGMNALKYFQFAAGSLPELGCTFATSGQIAKLKLQLMTL